ncbi:MAG: PAS domain S-box protein [Anaerolineaceae bacterium]|nr:PAS domain S-box protein [Anaerolineaceae bacterium]
MKFIRKRFPYNKNNQIIIFISITLFSAFTLALLSFSLIRSTKSVQVFQDKSRSIANMENFERESLRLQVEIEKSLLEKPEDFSEILLRRELLENQFNLIKSINDPIIEEMQKAFQEYLTEFDDLLEELMANPNPQTYEKLTPEFTEVLNKITLDAIKLYNSEETNFYNTTSNLLKAQKTSQTILLLMGTLVIGLSIALGLTSSRIAHSEILKINQELEAEIKERKQIENHLRLSEERFRLIVENIPILVNANGEDDQFIFWNQECENVTGYLAEEIIGNSKAMNWLYPDPDYLKELNREWVNNATKYTNFERTILTKNGEERVISWKNMARHYAIPGWKAWAIGIDITEQINIQNELIEREQEYESLFNSMLNVLAIYEIIFDENKQPFDYRFLKVNPAFEQNIDLKPEAVLGKTFREITGTIDPFQLKKYAQVALTGDPTHFEYYSPIVKKHWIVYAFQVKYGQFATISVDNTDRVNANKSLEYAKDIEKMISQISSNLMKSNLENIDQQILKVFSDTADFFDFDRIFLFLLDDDKENYVLNYEWTQPGLSPFIQKTIPRKNFDPDADWSKNLIRMDNIFVFDDIELLPKEGYSTKQFHKKMGSQSGLNIPLILEEKIIGFIGINSQQKRSWDDALLYSMKTISEIIANTTQRRKNFQALMRSENRYRAIVEDQVEFITRFLEDGTLTFVNKAYCEFMGKPAEELLGVSFLKFTPLDQHEIILAPLRPISIENPETVQQTNKVLDQSGKYRWVQWSNRGIFDDQGNIVEFQSSGLDITDRMKAEEELDKYKDMLEDLVDARTLELENETEKHRKTVDAYRAAKDASETANRAKSSFLANMSHELRTPLNAILGYAQLMRRDKNISTTNKDNVEIMIRSGEHLLNLINDVLQFSKIEAGKVSNTIKTFSLYSILDDLETIFTLSANKKGLIFSITKSLNTPDIIAADQAKLNQILMNLIGNAIKFTDAGSVGLGVHVEKIDLNEATLIFEVSDTGPGIDPRDINIIFEPFMQSAIGQKHKEGTGLGLPICREFARILGGSLNLTTKVGEGTTFIFNVPVELIANNKSKYKDENLLVISLQPNQKTSRILIVEDEDANRDLLIQTLEDITDEQGHSCMQVRAVTNGKESIQAWNEWRPDLIFMDMRMPVMDGFTATQQIKKQPGGEKTRIIALTASAFEEDRNQMIASGCDDLIIKPYQEIELFRALEKHLNIEFIYLNPTDKDQTLSSTADLTTEDSGIVGLLTQMTEDHLELKIKALSIENIRELKHLVTTFNTQAIIEFAERIEESDPELSDYIIDSAVQYEYHLIIKILDNILET